MKYSHLKIVWNDWPALASSIGIPMIWLVHGGFTQLHRAKSPLPLWFPSVVSMLCIALLAWRIGRVGRLFSRGTSAMGVITEVHIVKDRGRLHFEFEADGARVRSWMPVHKTKAVLSLSPGDRIGVLFDGRQPTRAVVKHLYAN